MSNATHDRHLQELLTTLLSHINRYGSRNERVREWAQNYKDVREFLELAAVVILWFETRKSDMDMLTGREGLRNLRKEVKRS